MRIHNILDETSVNGPGKRTTIWTQGCTVGCPGCTNLQTWTSQGGTEMTAEEIWNRIHTNVVDIGINGVTFSGGEPLEQFDGLMEVLQLISSKNTELGLDVDVLVFSGRYIEDIKDFSILNYIDIFVDGPYIEKDLNYDISWRGSSNQRVFLLNDHIRKKMRDKYEKVDEDGNLLEEGTGAEFFIGEDGELEMTGFGPFTDRKLKRIM